MNHNRELEAIASLDPRLATLPTISLSGPQRDTTHAQRRCQQRAISMTKLRIALGYGLRDHHHGQVRWTLLGRQLRDSPYARFEQELEGLQLVGRPDGVTSTLQLKTCKWVWAMRRH